MKIISPKFRIDSNLLEATVVVHHTLVAALCSASAAAHTRIVIGFAHRRGTRDNEMICLGLSGSLSLRSVAIVLQVVSLRR
jgi:hypothetical protein